MKNKDIDSRRKLYTVWKGMRHRCLSKNSHDFKWYGNRGISICDSWKDNFNEFFKWSTSNGWREGLQIDRINNNGNYEPSNCRFITFRANCQNRTSTKLSPKKVLEIKKLLTDGSKTHRDIARTFNVSKTTITNINTGITWSNI